jgi:hypothetical protein
MKLRWHTVTPQIAARAHVCGYNNRTDTTVDLPTVGIASGYRLDEQGVGVRVPAGSRIFFSPCRPDWLCGSPNALFSGYRGLFPLGYSDRGVKLTTHLQLVPRPRKGGSIHPLPYTPSRRSVNWLSTGTTLPYLT